MREYWEESFQTYDDFRPPREQLRLDDTIDLAKLLKEARVPREYRL